MMDPATRNCSSEASSAASLNRVQSSNCACMRVNMMQGQTSDSGYDERT